ncbi:MAG TPA: pyrroline-5-carboxylate reductase [Savagea sp.]
MKKIAFIGAGSMAEAIIAGIVKNEVLPANAIYVTNHSNQERLARLHEQYGVTPFRNVGDIEDVDVLIFATKPNQIAEVLPKYASLTNTVIVSVLAGTPLATFEATFPNQAIARVMPNTSATIGASASGVAWNTKVTDEAKRWVTSLIEAIGIVQEVDEEQLHTVTGLSGSGPAYVYFFVEALEAAAIQEGLDPKTARELAIQTIKGAALMLDETREEPATLRERVTSPNGTTAAGLDALREHQFEETILACVQAAKQRSVELGKA